MSSRKKIIIINNFYDFSFFLINEEPNKTVQKLVVFSRDNFRG
ncbi:MAG: hypothetical protein ACRCT1_19830 [Microcoleaceae cyanobacterium]